MDVEKVVSVYLKIRDKKAQLTKEYDAQIAELDAKQGLLEAALLDFCKDNGVENVKATSGTAFKTIKERIWVNDWAAVEVFVYENQAFDLLEHRIAQTAAKTWMKENPDKPIPSAVVDRKFAITVRRGTP